MIFPVKLIKLTDEAHKTKEILNKTFEIAKSHLKKKQNKNEHLGEMKWEERERENENEILPLSYHYKLLALFLKSKRWLILTNIKQVSL